MFERKRTISKQATCHGTVETHQEQPEEIKLINDEPLDILGSVRNDLFDEDSSTKRTRSKRKSALKANGNIKSCLENEEIEENIPKRLQRKRVILNHVIQEDKPDLIDISKLSCIKQEIEYDGVDLALQSEDVGKSQCDKGESLPDFSAAEFLETNLEEKGSGSNYVSSNKIYLKTNEILGIKTLKRPTKGPQQIAGSVDTEDSTFKIRCDHCGEQFYTKFRFNAHLQKIHNIKKEQCVLQCTYCPQKSKTTYSLKFHMLMYHLDELNLKTKWYKCSKCNLQSMDSEEIKIHKDVSIWCQAAAILLFHTCMECPFRTDRVSQLQGHIKWHYKSGGLKCPHCTFKCHPSMEKLMNEHLLLHKM